MRVLTYEEAKLQSIDVKVIGLNAAYFGANILDGDPVNEGTCVRVYPFRDMSLQEYLAWLQDHLRAKIVERWSK